MISNPSGHRLDLYYHSGSLQNMTWNDVVLLNISIPTTCKFLLYKPISSIEIPFCRVICLFYEQQEVEQALNSLCKRLPAQYSDVCSDFVKQYAPAILDLIGQELDPLTVCTILKLCTSDSKKIGIHETMSISICYILKCLIIW